MNIYPAVYTDGRAIYQVTAMATAEFTAIIKKSGHSNCIFIPIQQMDIIGVKLGDVIKVTIEKK